MWSIVLLSTSAVGLMAPGGQQQASSRLQATVADPPTLRAPKFTEVCGETGITLSRFMIEATIANPHLAELESIFSSIQTAGKTISNLVRRASLTGLTGYLDSGSINVQGEEQKKLDIITRVNRI